MEAMGTGKREDQRTLTLHHVTLVHAGDSDPAPHYRATPWVQPRTSDGLIDTRDVHAESEPVRVTAPDGTVIEDSAQGLIAIRPEDGAISFVDTWPAPHDGTVKPTEWFPA